MVSNYNILSKEKLLRLIEKILGVPRYYITLTDISVRMDAPKDNRNKLEWHQDLLYYRQNSNGKNGVVLWTLSK